MITFNHLVMILYLQKKRINAYFFFNLKYLFLNQSSKG